MELAEGFVAVKPLGPLPVRGLAGPVQIYEVTGAGPARTRLQATAQRGLTRFVGRDGELEQFHRTQQLAANGLGQIVAIVGEAGVGKSRLIHESIHAPSLQGWLVAKAASVSYGKQMSYLPVIDLLKGYLKIQDGDDPREIREKVTGKLLTLDRALEPTLPALLALFDLPVDDAAWQMLEPGQRRQHTLDAVKELLLREACEQPLLVIFEDLHWIDVQIFGERRANIPLRPVLSRRVPRRTRSICSSYRVRSRDNRTRRGDASSVRNRVGPPGGRQPPPYQG